MNPSIVVACGRFVLYPYIELKARWAGVATGISAVGNGIIKTVRDGKIKLGHLVFLAYNLFVVFMEAGVGEGMDGILYLLCVDV